MQIGAWFWRIVILSAMGSGATGAALAGDTTGDHQTVHVVQRVLDDGRNVIRYKGGTYIGYTYTQPDTREPVWHGRCTFNFKTGAVFEGMCADGQFVRGFVRSVDGHSVRFLDKDRSDTEAIRSAREKTGL